MRHGNYSDDPPDKINWRIISHLIPYLLESRNRVLLALFCLVLAKGAVLVIPFLLKFMVDSLEGQGAAQLAPSILIANREIPASRKRSIASRVTNGVALGVIETSSPRSTAYWTS